MDSPENRHKTGVSCGPMWASAPTTAHENSMNDVGGQGRPPLQPVLENRVWVEKPPHSPFRPVGADAHIGPAGCTILTENAAIRFDKRRKKGYSKK